MQVIFFIIFSIIFKAKVYAETEIKTQIHDIDIGFGNEVALIYLSTGQVVKFPTADKLQIEKLKAAVNNEKWFSLTINNKREIIKLEEIFGFFKHKKKTFDKSILPDEQIYRPSILKDLETAKKLFSAARTDHKRESQCYNRAHVWTYDWRIKNNLYSSKAWVFFTKKYIRKYEFEWWFHVAPMVHVVIDDKVKERVMDIKYSSKSGPIGLNQWTRIFMRDNADCPVVEKYTDHANFPESGSCFLMKSSMYYYQPVDLEEKQILGMAKSRWLEAEVKNAFLEAFDIILGEVP